MIARVRRLKELDKEYGTESVQLAIGGILNRAENREYYAALERVRAELDRAARVLTAALGRMRVEGK